MKVLTSITTHITSEGRRISYTYSEVDENSGAIIRDNVRESFILLETRENSEVLSAIKTVNDFVTEKMEA